jgi:hypothetical protein
MTADDTTDFAAASENGADAALDDGRRRRRRRGGRGRGRGRRGEGEGIERAEGVAAGSSEEDDEEYEDVAPAQPPHHAFGSVWDSQIGVPASASASAGGTTSEMGGDFVDDEDLDEPEVPEYLLAERRQRGQRQTGGRGGRAPRGRSAYQAALDRERYGSRAPQPTFGGGGGGGTASGGRSDRGRGRGGRQQYGGRPADRGPRQDDRQRFSEPRSAEPWSEVPPELEEMLRAELARKAPTGSPRGETPAPEVVSAPPINGGSAPAFSASPEDESPVTEAKPPRRTRSTKAAASAAASEESTAVPATEEAPAPKRSTRAKAPTSKSTTRSTKAKAAASDAEPKKPATRRRTTKTAPEEA